MENKNYLDMSDEELSLLCKKCDDTALEMLIKRLDGVINKCVSSFSDSRFEHDDLMQESLVAVFRAILTYDVVKGASLKTYASVCITNALKNFVKKKNNSLISADSLFVPLDEAPQGTTAAEDEYLSRENVDDLKESFKKILTPTEYKVFALFLEGMSYSEIAEELLQSTKSVDNAMQRVRRKLKTIL